MTRRCAVIGSPIAHSLSPALHRAAYRRLGLDWTYDAYEVDAAGLPGFLAVLDAAWRGLSLTMPLKAAALAVVDEASATARTAGAANTVLVAAGRTYGDNTDVPGMVAALSEQGIDAVDTAAVLGTGATARSSVVALQRLGMRRLLLYGRDPAKVRSLAGWADGRGVTAVVGGLHSDVREVDLLVSTVPAEALADPVVTRLVARAGALLDVRYDPWPSPLLARETDRVSITGIDLLAHQAVLQVSAMTGGRVAVDELRTVALTALGSPP